MNMTTSPSWVRRSVPETGAESGCDGSGSEKGGRDVPRGSMVEGVRAMISLTRIQRDGFVDLDQSIAAASIYRDLRDRRLLLP
jgi:hypothetical protein